MPATIPSSVDLRRKRIADFCDFDKLRSFLTKKSDDRGRERYRRVSITASTSFVAKALNILISFVSVPLTVHYLGTERYGVWLTISSLLTWMSMTDFGLAGNALVNVLSEANGKDDRVTARQYSSSAFWSLFGVAALLGGILALSFHLIPWRSVFQVSEAMSSQELNNACAWTLFLFVLGMPLSVQNSIYNAYQDGFMSNIWSIATNVLALLSLVVVSHFQGGLPQLVIALSGTRSLVALANVYYLFFHRYRWLLPIPSEIRWVRVKRLFKLGGKYMVTQLASLGIYQSQPMIITQLLGPSKVMIFVIAQKIITLPNDLVYMATAPLISPIGEAKARNDWNWIKGAYKNATLASIGFGVLAVGLTAAVAKPLIRIWAGPAAVPDWPLIAWLCVYTFFGIALMTAGQMLCGLEQVDALAVSITLCALSVIGLGILFAKWWGLSGIALSMAVSKLITFWPIQVYEVRRILKRAPSPLAPEKVLA